ncbi:heme NO-binding domain-containing protein [Roseovarius sp. 2305UL8-3]|uniref:heme NO-binding domain-containing protein n=1 Tax=Roseovarius conchicola TaxID=3121636 RepID=UPI0035286977
MHGLINRAIERFIRDTYGRDIWLKIVQSLDLGLTEFEAMMTYDEAITHQVLDRAAEVLERPRHDLLEDIGTYLVSHPNVEALRRLLRFGGMTFEEFLHSLDDLPERARLAVSDLQLPRLELRGHTRASYSLVVQAGQKDIGEFGYVMMGLLRTMADDYGALVYLEHKGGRNGTEIIAVELLETAFADGRNFSLGAGVAG